MWLTALWNHSAQPLQWGAVLTASLVAAAMDLRSRRIPNWLTVPTFLVGVAYAVVLEGWAGLGDSLAGTATMMAPFVLLFVLAGGGAGDAKLMGALGAWLGLINGLFTLGAVCLAGGVLAIGYTLYARRVREVGGNFAAMVGGLYWLVKGKGKLVSLEQSRPARTRLRTRMPYGLAILAGTVAAAVGVTLWRSTMAQ